MNNLDVDLRKIQLDVEKFMQTGEYPAPKGGLPQTPGAKKVIEYGMEEADSLHHNYLGTEHILLGLLRGPESVAAQVLHDSGVTLEEARAEVLSLLGHGIENPRDNTAKTEYPRVSGTPAMVEQFTDRAREVMKLAREESGRFHGEAKTEYPRVSGTPAMFEQFTDRARETIKLAREESERFHDEYIGTEHLLLGLIKEGNGVAAKVLQSLHVDVGNLRMEVETLVESGPGTMTREVVADAASHKRHPIRDGRGPQPEPHLRGHRTYPSGASCASVKALPPNSA